MLLSRLFRASTYPSLRVRVGAPPSLLHRPLLRSYSSVAEPQPTEEEIPHFTFKEEPLGLPASEGYGYFQGGPGDVLGPNGRFKIEAKLGMGTVSSVWLARDQT